MPGFNSKGCFRIKIDLFYCNTLADRSVPSSALVVFFITVQTFWPKSIRGLIRQFWSSKRDNSKGIVLCWKMPGSLTPLLDLPSQDCSTPTRDRLEANPTLVSGASRNASSKGFSSACPWTHRDLVKAQCRIGFQPVPGSSSDTFEVDGFSKCPNRRAPSPGYKS
jgi:hypothetical protein